MCTVRLGPNLRPRWRVHQRGRYIARMDTRTAPWAPITDDTCIQLQPGRHPADWHLEHEWFEPDTGQGTMVTARVCSMHLAGYLLNVVGPEDVATVEVYRL